MEPKKMGLWKNKHATGAVVGVLSLVVKTSIAAVLTTVWEVNDVSQFDYRTLSYETPTVPSNIYVEVTFPLDVDRIIDYGKETITYFGELNETMFHSELTKYVGSDPFGSGLKDQVAYTFPNVNDYDASFIEEFASQSNAHSRAGNQSWSYHIEIRVQRRGPSRGGTGNADYGFDSSSLLDFLSDAKENPENYNFTFSEYWEIFDWNTYTYLAGKGWSAYDDNVRLVEARVPEPSLISIVGMGLFLMAGFARFSMKTLTAKHGP